jgi:hypothetical protein
MPPGKDKSRRSIQRILSILVGLEHAQTALFSYLLPTLAQVIFPAQSLWAGLLRIYLLGWGTTVIAYPVGAWLMGRALQTMPLRKVIQMASLGLAGSTMLMGLVPDGLQLGGSFCAQGCIGSQGMTAVFGPGLVLAGLRIMQMSLARGLRASLKIASATHVEIPKALRGIVGYELATLMGIFTAPLGLAALWQSGAGLGWRVGLVLVGFIAGVCSWRLWTCLPADEFLIQQPGRPFKAHVESTTNPAPWGPSVDTVTMHDQGFRRLGGWKAFVCAALRMGPAYGPYFVLTHFLVGFLPQVSTMGRTELLYRESLFLLIDGLSVVLVGLLLKWWLAGPQGRNHKPMVLLARLLAGVALGLAALAVPAFSALSLWSGPLYGSFLRLGLTTAGVVYAVAIAVFNGQLYIQARWGSEKPIGPADLGWFALANSLGAMILGHSGPFICTTLYTSLGWLGAPGIYLSVLGVLAWVGFWADPACRSHCNRPS